MQRAVEALVILSPHPDFIIPHLLSVIKQMHIHKLAPEGAVEFYDQRVLWLFPNMHKLQFDSLKDTPVVHLLNLRHFPRLFIFGFPRHSMSSSNLAITSADVRPVSIHTCKIYLLKSSMIFGLRAFPPFSSVSWMKLNIVVRRSQIHALGDVGINRAA